MFGWVFWPVIITVIGVIYLKKNYKTINMKGLKGKKKQLKN